MSWRARPRPLAAARPVRRTRGGAVGWRGLVTRARAVGLALVIVSGGGVGWLMTDQRFALDGGSVEISGLHYTDAAAVGAAVGLPAGSPTNAFLVRTGDIRRALVALPAVAAADVRIALPHRLVVAVTERTAVLQVAHERATYLLDGDGMVLERRAADAPSISELPLIDDRRVELAIPIDVGRPIDTIDAAVMLQLGALTPALVGSAAPALSVSVDDKDGFVVNAGSAGWRAVFGLYTPTLRPPDLIAEQVQCLRSLLAIGESAVETIYLAPQDDRCGTYLPRPT